MHDSAWMIFVGSLKNLEKCPQGSVVMSQIHFRRVGWRCEDERFLQIGRNGEEGGGGAGVGGVEVVGSEDVEDRDFHDEDSGDEHSVSMVTKKYIVLIDRD